MKKEEIINQDIVLNLGHYSIKRVILALFYFSLYSSLYI